MVEQTVEQELTVARKKSAKPMLWVSMISMVMFFAGLTSAYVISMERDDWVTFDLPNAFYISTFFIVASSFTLMGSKRFLKQDKRQISLLLLVVTLFLGIGLFGSNMWALMSLKVLGYILQVQGAPYQHHLYLASL